MPSQCPGVPRSPGAVLSFPWQWEDYWRDIFPYRGPMIHAHARMRYRTLRANGQDIFFRPDGYIFNMIEINCYRGQTTRTEAELDQFLELVHRKHEYFRQRGIAYYFLLAPSRTTFLRDRLADLFELPDEHAFLARIKARIRVGDDKAFIFPDAVMHEYQARYPDRPLFFKRDNHWTHWGRAVAAAGIVRHLQGDFPSLPRLDPTQIPFVLEPEDQSFWAYMRLLGLEFSAIPPPPSIRVAPEWAGLYNQLASTPGRSSFTLLYASDSFMEILSQHSPEILSFASASRMVDIGVKSPASSEAVVARHPDVVLESVVIDALASHHYEGFMKNQAAWFVDSP